MKKEEFMRELEYLLQDIPDEEKEDAVAYYRDYLEEAGPENEEAVIQDFGSPERIAAIIRADLNGNLQDGGEFTDQGYEDERFRDPNYQIVKRMDLPEEPQGGEGGSGTRKVRGGQNNENAGKRTGGYGKTRPQEGTQEYGSQERDDAFGYGTQEPRTDYRRRNQEEQKGKWEWWQILGIIILVCIAAPVVFSVLLGIGGGAVGILAGAFGALVAVTISLAAVTFSLLLAGLVCIIVGIAHMAVPVQGILYLGIGLGIFGLGLLCLSLSGLYYGKFLPWLCRAVFNGIGRLVHREGVKG